MEDHLHLLVEGESEDAHFVSMMTLLRQRTAIAYKCVRQQRLWQGGYFERVLRRADNVFDVIEYIRNNPTAADLPIERTRYPYVWWTANV
jgi:REP element-mobilizing transposase RayT